MKPILVLWWLFQYTSWIDQCIRGVIKS